MTNEELQRLTDEELIEAVATKVMGWHGDFIACWRTYNHIIGRDRCSCRYSAKWSGDWNPLTDWNHTMEVRTKVGEMDVEFVFDGCRVWVWPEHTRHGMEVFDKSAQRAICLAALLAADTH